MRTYRSLGEGKAIVQLVLPPTWVARINALANQQGVNRSALIREALQRTYFEGSGEAKQGKESSNLAGGSTDTSAQERRPADWESAGGAQRPAEEPVRTSVPHQAARAPHQREERADAHR
jgi:Ribbon-helix-helix protein, copG family